LRGEASRIAKGSKIDWWIELEEGGTRFCFEGAKAKDEFAVICDSFGVPSRNRLKPHVGSEATTN